MYGIIKNSPWRHGQTVQNWRDIQRVNILYYKRKNTKVQVASKIGENKEFLKNVYVVRNVISLFTESVWLKYYGYFQPNNQVIFSSPKDITAWKVFNNRWRT